MNIKMLISVHSYIQFFLHSYFIINNCLTVSNIQLANVVSDIHGKSAQKILAKILENPSDTSFDIESLLHKSMLPKLEDISLAIDGFITPEQVAKLKIIEKHFDNLNICKSDLEKLIFELAKPYEHEIALLQTIPGINSKLTAIRIIAEVSNDVTSFPTSKHLCSWAGLTPTNNESAGKKKFTYDCYLPHSTRKSLL